MTRQGEYNGVVQIDSTFLVYSLKPAKLPHATPTTTGPLKCAVGQPWYHVHPPQTCDVNNDCQADGSIGRWCGPSRQDMMYLIATRAPFALVWCGPREWAFFFPHQLEFRP